MNHDMREAAIAALRESGGLVLKLEPEFMLIRLDEVAKRITDEDMTILEAVMAIADDDERDAVRCELGKRLLPRYGTLEHLGDLTPDKVLSWIWGVKADIRDEMRTDARP